MNKELVYGSESEMDSAYWIRTLTATPKRIYKCQPGMVPSINLVDFSYQYHQVHCKSSQ